MEWGLAVVGWRAPSSSFLSFSADFASGISATDDPVHYNSSIRAGAGILKPHNRLIVSYPWGSIAYGDLADHISNIFPQILS